MNNFIYGKNPVKEKLLTISSGVLFIQNGINKNSISDIIDLANKKKINITYLDKVSFIKFFGNKKQGIVLKTDEQNLNFFDEKEFFNKLKNEDKNKSKIVILDGIKDVGNLGSIIRTSLLFDVDYIIIPKDNSAPINEVVIKRSSGAVFLINIVYATNITRVIKELKNLNYWVYACDIEGEKINKKLFNSNKIVLVFGEEGRGIRDLVKKNCDFIISIPTNKKIDSLNISVSAGIILYKLYED